ncbi:MAG TPA: leucine-rich repeat domain-containing protein [Verrucomicrobiae bacterium]|nr:leucine-rich repeat domain-containing protein [Verrucomicrobiae bacterium]
MKKTTKLYLRLGIAVLGLLSSAAAHAQLTFVTNNGAITITGYTGPTGAVIIPDDTNGLPVTSIAANAFHLKGNVTSITLPDSITNIGQGAFQVCYALTNINIPGSVLSIGPFAVDGCNALTTVTLGCGLRAIGTNMFSESAMNTIVIPNSVTSIGDLAFDRSGLTNIIISANLATIGSSAFSGSLRLRSLYFLGNPPGADATVFTGDTNVTIYYLPHTTGWSNTFAGIPTALWLPPLPPLGITSYSNQPVVILPYLAESIGKHFVVQMTTNLASGPWVNVTNGVPFLGVQITNAPSPAYFRLN